MKRAATPRLRGRAGQKQRLRRLKRSRGLCEHCLREKRTVAATVVDHIVPLALGRDRFLEAAKAHFKRHG